MKTVIATSTWAVYRIVVGLLFLEHGLQKLFGFFGGVNGTVVPLNSQLGAAGCLELVGGTLLVMGLLTRPVAAVLCAEMIAAFVIAHWPQGRWPIQNQGELALVYAAAFLSFAGQGAGALSLDALIWSARGHQHWERRRIIGDRRAHAPALTAL